MMDLEKREKLVKSDMACIIAILIDALGCDTDLNENRQELKNLISKLAYLVVGEG